MLRIIFSWFILLPLMIRAQTKELDSVVVSASYLPQKNITTGRNIITLNSADLAKLPVNSIDEWLRYAPGIEIQQRGPAGSQSDIVLDYLSFKRTIQYVHYAQQG